MSDFKSADEVKTVFEHASRLADPLEVPPGFRGAPVVLVPQGWTAETPRGWVPEVESRIRQKLLLKDHASFCRYVNAFKTSATQIFANPTGSSVTFTAVLDYHGAPLIPEACAHRATFTPEHSVNWKRWAEINAKPLSQVEFATFLENNTGDVASPSGADLLQIINEFEVEGVLQFQKVQRLQNGSVKFAFNNEQTAKAGELKVPETFALKLAIWNGEPLTDLLARLRYRLSPAGELKVWFELINPHEAIQAGVESLLERVKAGTALTPFLAGTVE